MRRTPIPPEAIHAYQHALAVQHAGVHRFDIVDAPVRPRRLRYRRVGPVSAMPVGEPTLTHRFEAPTSTAFKAGFGFTAGALSVRALVALAAGTALVLGLIRLLEAVSG